jgi:hypothetical protein
MGQQHYLQLVTLLYAFLVAISYCENFVILDFASQMDGSEQTAAWPIELLGQLPRSTHIDDRTLVPTLVLAQ